MTPEVTDTIREPSPVVGPDDQDHSNCDRCNEQDPENPDVSELSTECAVCRSDTHVSWCSRCDITYCDNCWDLQAPHKPARTAHQKADLQIRDVLNSISCQSEQCQDFAHLSACSSKWFGVSCVGEAASLRVFSRLRDLTIDADFEQNQYPALISFIGETGTGKSTIISALMKVCGIKKNIMALLVTN